MRDRSVVATAAAVMLVMCASLTRAADTPPEPWRQLYTGAEATGPNVIALWQFLPGQEARDSSGRGHTLSLRGEARFLPDGLIGGMLESFPADSAHDKPQGALATDANDLSPAGAFTLEAWFKAKPEMAQYDSVFLFDKKYFHYAKAIPEANWDYALYMRRAGPNRRRLIASLGFGKDSDFVDGPEIEIAPHQWRHVAFTYDGAGRCRFFIDGKLTAKAQLAQRGPIAPGNYGLVIGDRFGSTYNGFPGYLSQVRVSNGIVPYFTGGLVISVGSGRTAFVRMERDAKLSVVLSNDTAAPLTGGRAQIVFGGATKDVTLPALAPNQEQAIPVTVDTAVRPGSYALKVKATATGPQGNLQTEKEVPVTIVPRPVPNTMPVVMWGGGDTPRLKAIGFTHQLIGLVSEQPVWEAGHPVPAMSPAGIEQQGRMLDDLLKNGLYGAVYVHPGTWVTGDPVRKASLNRVDRTGQVRENPNVCGNFLQVRQFCFSIGASVAQTFGQYPALNAALIHSEVRDGSDLCFHDHDKELFRQAAGFDIPAEAVGKGGVHYSRIRNFPSNRVVNDDDHILTFYRWFWKDGDGWNPLHSEVHRGLKSTGRKDLWTFFDPAVRVPDVWGSGGDVDVISQWTYSYPDPIKIGQSTDELFAMAEGKPGQQVMKMTQVIWYRSGTAPKLPEDESKRAQWEKDLPTAEFITIAPDHMREAFWSKMSRPIRGIMYHGWQSLVDAGSKKGYVFTNPRTQEVLTELTRNVVRPLGPTLLQVPDRKPDVAVLESFASQVFAGRGTHGWSGSWEADMHLMLQWAHLQPKIVFDETVLRDGLTAYRVLVMPYCDVLTKGVVRRIKDFQQRGGIVVADEFLCPAIVPDIVIPTIARTGKAEPDKARLQAAAGTLRRELDPFYTRYGDTANPDIVLRFRQYGDSDYLFALNDRRTYGGYVGHHLKVMEQGLPTWGTLTVGRKGGFVYDLVRHVLVPSQANAAGLEFDASFGPGDGTVFMVTDQKIASVRLTAPAAARRGQPLDVTVSVVDSAGAPIKAIVPVHFEIIDPQGKPAEFSGYYGAKDGTVTLHLNLAANDAPGGWTIRAQELASGRTHRQRLVVS